MTASRSPSSLTVDDKVSLKCVDGATPAAIEKVDAAAAATGDCSTGEKRL